MEPLIATAGAASGVAMAETIALHGTLGSEVGHRLVSDLEIAAEMSEVVVGERGLVRQLETIRFGSLESVTARNDALLKTRNAELAGGCHPETQVPFEAAAVRLPDGRVLEGIFPEFKSAFDTKLSDELLQASDYKQSQYCNEQLRQAIASDANLKTSFSDVQRQQIAEGDTPDGYTWHHHQEPGRMQLVDSSVHLKTGHTGGKEIWGGGR
jgi:hypothetical protein